MSRKVLVIVLMFFSTASFAQDDIAKSSWMQSPVKIDGKPLEWKLPLRYYDAGTKLFFDFANDDKNLYVCFQAPGDMEQVKIMRAGMEVYLSIKGKNKISVAFPLANQSTSVPLENDNSGQQNADRQGRRAALLLQNTMMEVKGFETRNGVIPINDSSGINAAINWDENDKLTYEVAIPLKEWLGANYTAADISKDIALDAEINAVKKKIHPVANEDGEDGFPGKGRGGRMGGGGGMHHKANATGDDDNPSLPGENKWSMYEKSKLKEKFILAKNDTAKQ